MSAQTVIRTPDQRLRVFVSSTLGELTAERAEVRKAVERLHLAPVMFELGARPHPPRELYRAYLAQSHVFVGIYWERYGWVAPSETVSGLEDEYRLAGDLPKLLYIKQPAADREPRLDRLLEAIKSDDHASYKRFSSAEQLADQVEHDLAVLLTERFEAAKERTSETPAPRTAPPVPLTETVGRADSVLTVARMLRNGARMVTLTGAGGIGKTRLALEVGRELAGSYRDGVHFVPLAPVTDPGLVVRTIADRLAVRVEGARSVRDAVIDHLRRQEVLLLLDNLEQVVEAGIDLAELLGRCSEVRILATSRQALRLHGEHEVPVAPLPLPDPRASLDQLAAEPAVRLFVDRARAVSAGFVLTEDSAPVVARLCHRLDGLPLAIELAAARVRLLSPAALLERLTSRLDVLAGGGPDLPERQRTLRTTLDWSYRLLDERERALFARLSVFAGGCSLEAAEAVCDADSETEVLETLASLLDKSLLVIDEDPGDPEPRFRMLETVRVYAAERLDEHGDTDLLRRRHLSWYRKLADHAQPFLCGPGQREWAARFDPERANLRAAASAALELQDDEAVIELVWDVIVFYFIRDAVSEPESWLARVAAGGRPLDEVLTAKLRSLQTLLRLFHGDSEDVHEPLESSLAVFTERGMSFEAAVALKELAFVRYMLDGDADAAIAALHECSRLFDSVGHDWGAAVSEAMLGSVLVAVGDLATAETHHRMSLTRARRIDNEPLIAQALQQLAVLRLLTDQPDEALDLLDDAAHLLRRGRYQSDATLCLDVLAAVAIARDDAETAARAVAVAEAVRTRLGTSVWPTVQALVASLIDLVQRRLGEPAFQAITEEAATEDLFETLDDTLAAVHRISLHA